MDYIQDCFYCDNCKNKEFTRIYGFSLKFHGVNFSDELIYDRLTDELYRCTECNRTYTKGQIEEGLNTIKRAHKQKP